MNELMRRDYNIEDYRDDEDQRFVDLKKEVCAVYAWLGSYLVLIYIFAHALCPEDMSEMTYLFGFPKWFMWCAILTIVAYMCIVFILRKVFKPCSYEARDTVASEKEE